MITVAGFNTAIDRRLDVDALQPGTVQRARSTQAQARPGGKGLHVAQMVAELGEPVRLVGLTDAAHGARIAAQLRRRQVAWIGIDAPHGLRQCLAVREADGRMTEILEPGEALETDVRQALLEALLARIADSDVLVLSGSLPRGFPHDTYAHLVRAAAARGVRCLVDASGDALRCAVDAAPWLVKANADEAASLAGSSVRTVAHAVDAACRLQRRGAANVVVTLGARGAVAHDGATCWHAWSDPVDARNSVGSGDCFLAALAVGTMRDEPLSRVLRHAVACGAANAANEETGFAAATDVAVWLSRVHVREIAAEATTGASSPHAVDPCAGSS